MCGAPAATDATKCDHCGARLATVACPSCFGLMFAGAKFCSHCGAKADREVTADSVRELCPRCNLEMTAVVIGGVNLRECARCEGIWADSESFRQICADREKQAAVLGMAGSLPAPDEANTAMNVRYVPCPICRALMNRVNFAHCSHVVVNVCVKHGTWFDRDELRRIVEFIRAGGLEQARDREMAELEEERKAVKAARLGAAEYVPEPSRHDGISIGLTAVADVLGAFLRRQ
jgi:Zn-finger nucleic acid-binding protein